MKAMADSIICLAQKLISGFEVVENSVGKGENAFYRHSTLFPKALIFRITTNRIVWWSYTITLNDSVMYIYIGSVKKTCTTDK